MHKSLINELTGILDPPKFKVKQVVMYVSGLETFKKPILIEEIKLSRFPLKWKYAYYPGSVSITLDTDKLERYLVVEKHLRALTPEEIG
jgi:hypothetical protein